MNTNKKPEHTASDVTFRLPIREDFIEEFPEIYKNSLLVLQWEKECNWPAIVEHCEKFCSAYQTHSRFLTGYYGTESVLKNFVYLKKYFQYAMPYEFELLERLPDTLTLYRGARPPFENAAQGYSWSTRPIIAQGFMKTPGDIVVRGRIPRDKVLAFFPLENECVINPSDIIAGSGGVAHELTEDGIVTHIPDDPEIVSRNAVADIDDDLEIECAALDSD